MHQVEANLFHKLLAIFFFPFLIFARLISPFYKIRLNLIMSERIGHFAESAGLSLCEKIQGGKYKDIYWFRTPTCNTQLEKMVKRVFFVNWWVRCLILANNFFPSLKLVPFENRLQKQKGRDTEGLYFKTKDIKEAYLPFSHNEEVEAKQVLKHLGIGDSDKFVCLMVRDSKYLSTFYPKWDWTYHSYRDTNINTYKEAIEALANLGYWVFRMGKKVKEPLNINHPRVIDYAHHEIRSDLLDIWLPANAYFSISTSTGLDAVAEAYRHPVVYVNAMTNDDFRSYSHCIWAPKNLMWESKTGNLLTLKETLLNNFHHGELYKEKGIKIIDLSSEQIKEVVLEMESRLTGSWKVTEEEELNQSKLIKIISSWKSKEKMHGFIHPEARISQKYLEYNPSFLSDD
jgi:putative glycosyltransferase (TIGR04372 family)